MSLESTVYVTFFFILVLFIKGKERISVLFFFYIGKTKGKKRKHILNSAFEKQSYRTLAEREFGWGGTSVITKHRCPKDSSVRTETSP